MQYKVLKQVMNVILVFTFVISFANAGQIETTAPAASLGIILPESYIKSANYRVNVLGFHDGYYQFSVESDLGNYKVDSIPVLLKRLQEIDVIVQVSNQRNEDFDPYASGLQSELKIQGDSAVDLLSSPLSAASNFAGQLATNLGDTLSGRGSVHDYQVEGEVTPSHDPIYIMHKRNAASQLGLDVYTRNVQAQMFLNRLASLRSAGEISAGAKLLKLNGQDEIPIASGAIDRKASNTIRKLNLEELGYEQQSIMSSMDIEESLQDDFLQNTNILPSLKLAILYYAEHLRNVDGRSELITLASILDNPISAEAFLQLMKMVSLYDERIAKLKQFKSSGTILSATTEDGRLLHFYSRDIFILSEPHKILINRISKLSRKKHHSRSELVLYGDISDQARSELLENNIDYREFFLRRL